MNPPHNAKSMHIEPLGDQALLITCADERQAQLLAEHARLSKRPWLVDVVSAYTTVALYFDLMQCDYAQAASEVRQWTLPTGDGPIGQRLVIPCCYELGLDWDVVTEHVRLPKTEIIRLHSATLFTVYAIGFSPGFPYLGYLPTPLQGVPRLPQPRKRVEPGSVGITGVQSAIYPLPTPGGWHLIGQTPCVMVDVAKDYFPLRVGDQVQFQPIDQETFAAMHGKRVTEVR